MRYLLKITCKPVASCYLQWFFGPEEVIVQQAPFMLPYQQKNTGTLTSIRITLLYAIFFSDLMKISSILLQISNIVLCILSNISWSGICFVIFTFFPKPCSGHFLFFHYIFPNVPLSRFCKHWSYVGWSPSQISRPSVLLVRLRHPFEPPNNWKSEFQSQAAQHLISYKL